MIFPGAGREASAYPGASPGRAEGPIAFSPWPKAVIFLCQKEISRSNHAPGYESGLSLFPPLGTGCDISRRRPDAGAPIPAEPGVGPQARTLFSGRPFLSFPVSYS